MDETPDIPLELQRYIAKRVNDALRRYRNQAVVGFAILLLGLVGAFYVDSTHNADQRDQLAKESAASQKAIVTSGDAIAVAGCNRDYDTIDALRDELERSLLRTDALEKAGTLSHALAEAGRENTLEILTRYKLPDCRRADEVLTANPGKPTVVPAARYPNDPQQRKSEAQETKELGQPSNVP